MKYLKLIIWGTIFILSACGGGGGDAVPPPNTQGPYNIGGTVTGLNGTGLQIQINGSETIDITNDGTYQFPTTLPDGDSYDVTVITQPINLSQTCNITNASGAISGSDITDIQVNCVTDRFNITVNASGLTDLGLTLQNNGTDDLAINNDGLYSFSMTMLSGDDYAVTVLSEPNEHACALSANNSGAVTDSNIRLDAICNPYVARFAYVNNTLDDTISMYTVNSQTGSLRHNGYIQTGDDPRYMAMDPQQRFVFTANNSSNDVSAFIIDEITGHLSEIGGSPYPTEGMEPRGMVVTPNSRYLYVVNSGTNDIAAFDIDSESGSLDTIGNFITAGIQPRGIAVNPQSNFVYVANAGSNDISAYMVNPQNGGLIPLDADASVVGLQDTIPAGDQPSGMVIDATGRYLYVTNFGDGSITTYRIDSGSGALTEFDSFPSGLNQPYSISLDNSGQYAYVSFSGSNVAMTYSVSNGELTPIGSAVATGDLPRTLQTFPNSDFVYVANAGSDNISIFEINDTSGGLVPAGTALARNGSRAIVMKRGRAPVQYVVDNVYVVNEVSDDVTHFTANPDTGELTTAATQATSGNNPRLVAIDPEKRFAYVTNALTDDIAMFDVNVDGTLSDIDCGGIGSCNGMNFVPGGDEPTAMVIEPSGRFAYIANRSSDDVTALIINADGTLTLIDCGGGIGCNGANYQSGRAPRHIAIDPSGRYVYIASQNSRDISAFSINANGSLNLIDCGSGLGCNGALFSTGSASSPFWLSITSDGRYLYTVGRNSDDVIAFVINSGGSLTQLDCGGGTGCNGMNYVAGDGPSSIATSPVGGFVYITNEFSEDVSAFRVNSNGSLTQIDCGGGVGCNGSNYLVGVDPYAVAVDPAGKYVYVADQRSNDVTVFNVSPDGALTPVSGGNYSVGLSPSAITVTGSIE